MGRAHNPWSFVWRCAIGGCDFSSRNWRGYLCCRRCGVASLTEDDES